MESWVCRRHRHLYFPLFNWRLLWNILFQWYVLLHVHTYNDFHILEDETSKLNLKTYDFLYIISWVNENRKQHATNIVYLCMHILIQCNSVLAILHNVHAQVFMGTFILNRGMYHSVGGQNLVFFSRKFINMDRIENMFVICFLRLPGFLLIWKIMFKVIWY